MYAQDLSCDKGEVLNAVSGQGLDSVFRFIVRVTIYTRVTAQITEWEVQFSSLMGEMPQE